MIDRDVLEKRPGGPYRQASKPPTGPAPPRRSVCAPRGPSFHRRPHHEGDDNVVPLFTYAPKVSGRRADPPVPTPTDRPTAARGSPGGPQPAVGHRHARPE